MSWFGHTFLVVVQDAYLGSDKPLPTDPAVVALACGRIDPAVGRFIASRYTKETLPDLFAAAGVIPEA
jgi:hypothetical protein